VLNQTVLSSVKAACDPIHTTVERVDQHRHRTPRGGYRDGDSQRNWKSPERNRSGRVCRQE